MADWSLPTLSSTYTNFLAEVKSRDTDLALQFDGTTTTNIPTGAIRWTSSANTWQKWTGSAWGALSSTFAFPAITTTGSVGIGTSGPISTLDVKGGLTITSLADWNSKANTVFELANPAVRLGIGYNSSDQVLVQAFDSSNASRSLALQPYGGNVGIGTSTPDGLLHVNGDAILDKAVLNTPRYLKFNANSDGTGTPSYGGITWYNYQWDSSKRAEITSGPDGTVAAGYLAFSTGTTGITERMRIDKSGRVGIGTNAPTENLTVYGVGSRLAVTGSSGLSAILLGNQDSGGANNPAMIGAANGELYFGGGSSWSGGGTLDYKMFISDTGNVGIGTTTPGVKVAINDPGTGLGFTNAAGGNFNIGCLAGTSSSNAYVFQRASGALILGTSDTERARIDSSGRLLVGTSTARTSQSVTPAFQVEGTSFDAASIQLTENTNDAQSSYLTFNKSRATSIGGNTVVQNGDNLGQIRFAGTDGSIPILGATIQGQVDGTPGANDMPGRLVFSTTADGSASATERFRISSTGAQSSVIPGGSTLYPSFGCRAWVNFNGTGTVAIRSSGNVSSITDNGVGDYTVNFTTAMPDANYAAVSESNATGVGGSSYQSLLSFSSQTASSVRFTSVGDYPSAGNNDKDNVSVAIFR